MGIVSITNNHILLQGYHVSADGKDIIGLDPEWYDYPSYIIFKQFVAEGLAGNPNEEVKIENHNLMTYALLEDDIISFFNQLSLPELYNGYTYIESEGPLGTPDGIIRISFPEKITNSGPYRNRNYLRYGILIIYNNDISYTCHPYLYLLFEAIDLYNQEIKLKNKEKIFLLLANIKNLAKKCNNVYLGPIINSEEIIKIDNIFIEIEESNDSISLIPNTTDLLNTTTSFKEKFKKVNSVDSIYNFDSVSHNRIRAVLTEKKRTALDIIKKYYQNIKDPHIFRSLIDNPPIEFDEANIDLSNLYSDRVKELGIYRPRSYPFICPYKTEWIPGIMIVEDGVKKPILFKDQLDLEYLINAINEANNAGKDYIEINNNKIDIETAKNIVNNNDEINILNKKDVKEVSKKLSLIIEENIEELEYIEKNNESFYKYLSVDIPWLKKDITLKNYQKEGINRIISLYYSKFSGALLADDMGLGKTLQVLCFLEYLSYKENNLLACIVAPKGLINNWISEYHYFFSKPNLYFRSLVGESLLIKDIVNNQEKQRNIVFLFSYETLRAKQLELCAIKWTVAILDEAQKIKNVGTQITNASKALNAKFKIAITGTPVENSFHDLWCISDFCFPGFLGSARDFSNNYSISKNDSDDVIINKGELLKNKLGIRFIRRIKENVLKDLPPKYESVNPSHSEYFKHLKIINIMPEKQCYKYDELINNYINKHKNSNINNKNDLLNILIKLKIACEHPVLLSENNALYLTSNIEDSAKTLSLIDILYDIRKKQDKAIVFSEYKKTQRLLSYIIYKTFGIKAEIINGDTPTDIEIDKSEYTRSKIINNFNNSKGFNVIIMSPIAAGVGLNVTGANHVIHFSRHWNPAKEDQATDRAYRIGQNKAVYVYYLIARHPKHPDVMSFDENLSKLLNEKRKIQGSILYPTAKSEVKPDELYEKLFATK